MSPPMSNASHTTNPMMLPDDLPRPVDDGGADHLPGMRMPAIALRATSGETVDLSALPGPVAVSAAPTTGVPGAGRAAGWNDIPAARGCTPPTLSFPGEKDAFAACGVPVGWLSTQDPDYQKELTARLGLTSAI